MQLPLVLPLLLLHEHAWEAFISKIPKGFIHKAFEYGILLKGLNGLFETVGGVLLLSVDIHTIQHFLLWLSLFELPHGHHDFLANYFRNLAGQFSTDTKMVGGIYLLGHGIFKIGLMVALQLKKSWAFPVGICFLLIFICYQVYRLTLHFNYLLLGLTLVDATLTVLIYREYKAQKVPEGLP